ncbi:hypothetical protein FRB98_004297, partial [Tulasnella sp. 332]
LLRASVNDNSVRVKGSSDTSIDGFQVGQNPVVYGLSTETRRLLDAYDVAHSEIQRHGMEIVSHGPALLIDKLRSRAQDVVDGMMEERVLLLSQIQELGKRLELMDLKAGNSSQDDANSASG